MATVHEPQRRSVQHALYDLYRALLYLMTADAQDRYQNITRRGEDRHPNNPPSVLLAPSVPLSPLPFVSD